MRMSVRLHTGTVKFYSRQRCASNERFATLNHVRDRRSHTKFSPLQTAETVALMPPLQHRPYRMSGRGRILRSAVSASTGADVNGRLFFI